MAGNDRTEDVIDHPKTYFFEHSPEYVPSTSSLWLAKAAF
jgi:hypothetical protein